MVKYFKTKNANGAFIVKNTPFGIGFHIDFIPPILTKEKRFSIIIDLIFIRFWWNVYKKH